MLQAEHMYLCAILAGTRVVTNASGGARHVRSDECSWGKERCACWGWGNYTFLLLRLHEPWPPCSLPCTHHCALPRHWMCLGCACSRPTFAGYLLQSMLRCADATYRIGKPSPFAIVSFFCERQFQTRFCTLVGITFLFFVYADEVLQRSLQYLKRSKCISLFTLEASLGLTVILVVLTRDRFEDGTKRLSKRGLLS